MARSRKSQNLGLLSSKFIVKVPLQRSRRRKKSVAQKENESHFQQAASYGAECMTIPERKALYEKGINRRKNNAYTVACTDYLTPPTVHDIKVIDNGPAGSAITIKATDDFEVKSVGITLAIADGKVIEEGPAVRNRLKRQMWKYETKVVMEKDMTITAVAEDHAGNVTEGFVVLE